MPFNSSTNGTGRLAVVPTDATAYEINGIESTGSVGLGQLAGLGTGTTTVAYGTMTAANSATATAASPTSALFTATQVLAGSSLVTGVTGVGQYTASSFSLSATSITLFLNN